MTSRSPEWVFDFESGATVDAERGNVINEGALWDAIHENTTLEKKIISRNAKREMH